MVCVSIPLISVGQALGTLDFASQIRRKCVKSLYKACAGHVLLPSSLHLELHGDPVGTPLHEGGFGDVRKREYRGREVAVKDLRVNRHKDLRGVTSVSNWLAVVSSRVG